MGERGNHHLSRPSIALIVPFSRLWENAVGYDVGAHCRKLADRVGRALAESASVVVADTVSSREEGQEAGRRALATGAEVVLVVQTMGVQPAYVLATLDEWGDGPSVIWCAHSRDTLPPGFDHAAITSEGGTVGTPMLTNLLVRRGRPFELLLGRIDDPVSLERVVEALEDSTAAVRLSRSRIGRVGVAIDGYDCVVADDDQLRRDLGVTIVEIDPTEIRRLFLEVDRVELAALEAEVRATFDVSSGIRDDELERSLRAAIALEHLVTNESLSAGIMNCHVPEIRFHPEIGVAPCFGLGRSTSVGVPWSCAGDVLTVVPMLALKLLGEPSVYHELEARDHSTDEFVVANTGEHDLTFAGVEKPQLVTNGWFASDPFRGVCACYSLPPGDAAIVGFTQLEDRHRFIVAPGELTGRSWPLVGTVNGAFRFAAGRDGWSRWCEAGSNHHSALTNGNGVARFERLCRLLGVECIRI